MIGSLLEAVGIIEEQRELLAEQCIRLSAVEELVQRILNEGSHLATRPLIPIPPFPEILNEIQLFAPRAGADS